MRLPWVPALAALLVVALALADAISGESTVIVPLYVLGPLLAAVASGRRATAAVGVLASVLAAVMLAFQHESVGQDLVRLGTVVLGSAVAVWIAALRERLQSAAALLDVIFEHAPVGIALLDVQVRYVRVNTWLADRTAGVLTPDLPDDVRADVARVVSTGEPLSDVVVTGDDREFTASYWPVRAADGELMGVGIVVAEITERRFAERALRAQTDRYETLLLALSEAGEGLVVLERDGHCVYANHAFEQLSGYTFPELAAMESALDLIVEYDVDEVRRRALGILQSGPVRPGLRRTLRRRDGERVDLEIGAVPLELDDRRQLVVVVRDVSARLRAEAERERLLARAALLAEASELFDQSLDEDETIRSVARLCVRGAADTCVILLGGDDATRRVASAAHGDQPAPALDQLTEAAMADVLRTGTGVVADRTVIVPLRARGRVLGVLAAGFEELPADEAHDQLALFEDLARRAALALDSAGLYAERDHVARTLQRSLLPAELPDIPGVEVAARYLAAGAGNEVGGDFYDCFATGAGDWALVIGDVCGKGAEAAALTALARYTVRAAALHTRAPAAVLRELNEALLRDRLDYRFCTVLYASLTPREDRVSVCVAAGGHPLPLVVRAGGEVETVGSPGSLLGIFEFPQIPERSVDLMPGDALVMCTDGVTEADRESTPDRLASFLADYAGADPAAIAAAVERDALDAQDGLARDDVAVVVVRAGDGEAAPFPPQGAGVATPT